MNEPKPGSLNALLWEAYKQGRLDERDPALSTPNIRWWGSAKQGFIRWRQAWTA